MCEGGRLLADFIAGEEVPPEVPDVVGRALVPTADGRWVVWAYKAARRARGGFIPLNARGGWYPPSAIASCWRRGPHAAPDPHCTCGFHAVSSPQAVPITRDVMPGIRRLEVALSGRVLAFRWAGGGVLFRAAEQVVIAGDRAPAAVAEPRPRRPEDEDLDGARRRPTAPRGAGPVRLELPGDEPRRVVVRDDAGWCRLVPTVGPAPVPSRLAQARPTPAFA